MTLTPDRLDDLDFDPVPEIAVAFNDALVLRQEEPMPTMTMEDWQATMDDMESSYRSYLHERAAQPNPAHSFYDDMVAARERIRRDEEMRRRTFEDHYCWCSPGRGLYFERHHAAEDFAAYQPPGVYYDAQPGPQLAEPIQDEWSVTVHTWMPTPEPETLASTGSMLPILAGIGCSVMAGFIGCLVFTLAALH